MARASLSIEDMLGLYRWLAFCLRYPAPLLSCVASIGVCYREAECVD
jgi:hypothetical protein